jgi:nicotinamidase-related amidase
MPEIAKSEGRFVVADPYPWPYDGALRPDNTALIVIDMQTDFCGVGGYVDKMGYDLSLTRAPIEPIRKLLAAMRSKGFTIRGRAARFWCEENRAGRSFRSWPRCRAKWCSTSRAKGRSARPISN